MAEEKKEKTGSKTRSDIVTVEVLAKKRKDKQAGKLRWGGPERELFKLYIVSTRWLWQKQN
jgi:hypothetical protein